MPEGLHGKLWRVQASSFSRRYAKGSKVDAEVSFSDFTSRAYVKASTVERVAQHVHPFSAKISIEREKQSSSRCSASKSETDLAKEARAGRGGKNKIALRAS
jgi:hypothetical protein